MGIVVTVFMLLGLLMASPWPKGRLARWRSDPTVVGPIGKGLLLSGAWNTLWHGLRNLDNFWGIAALLSGLVMIAVAVIILVDRGVPSQTHNALIRHSHKVIKPFTIPLLVALLLCMTLYAVTLARLNLGYTILGSSTSQRQGLPSADDAMHPPRHNAQMQLRLPSHTTTISHAPMHSQSAPKRRQK